MLAPVAAIFITGVCLVAIIGALLLWSGRSTSRLMELCCLALLGVLPMTYLAALFPFYDWGGPLYGLFLVAGALALGVLYWLLRTAWLHPLVAGYAALLTVITVNVVFVSSRWNLGTVFGDSAIVAGRFSGINNVTFAQVMVAGILLAVIAVHTVPGPRGRALMVAILAFVLIIDAAPMWGADVGGALAGVPALALVGTRLGGWRIRWQTVALWLVATVVVVVAFGMLDLTRDPTDRTHLGRFFERIGEDGYDGFATVVERKAATNVRSLTGSIWRFILIPVILGTILVAWRAPGRLRTLGDALPELRAALPGLLVAAVLGYAVNDSGIAVPGMMVAALVPAIVYLLFRTEEPRET